MEEILADFFYSKDSKTLEALSFPLNQTNPSGFALSLGRVSKIPAPHLAGNSVAVTASLPAFLC